MESVCNNCCSRKQSYVFSPMVDVQWMQSSGRVAEGRMVSRQRAVKGAHRPWNTWDNAVLTFVRRGAAGNSLLPRRTVKALFLSPLSRKLSFCVAVSLWQEIHLTFLLGCFVLFTMRSFVTVYALKTFLVIFSPCLCAVGNQLYCASLLVRIMSFTLFYFFPFSWCLAEHCKAHDWVIRRIPQSHKNDKKAFGCKISS